MRRNPKRLVFLEHRLLETKKFVVVLGSGHVCGGLRVHFNVTSISLRFHFGFTSISLRVHFDSISISLRCHFDVTLISLRLEGTCLHGSVTSLFRGNLDGRCETYHENTCQRNKDNMHFHCLGSSLSCVYESLTEEGNDDAIPEGMCLHGSVTSLFRGNLTLSLRY